MNKFEYLTPGSIDEAISLLVSHGERARFVAGGTDVMVKIKEGKISPQYLVSLRRIQGLDRITFENGELRIGSLVTHRMLELSPIIRKEFPILTDAVTHIGSVQVRNVATIGGNVVNAVPSADGAIPLITLAAQVRYGTLSQAEFDAFYMGRNPAPAASPQPVGQTANVGADAGHAESGPALLADFTGGAAQGTGGGARG